MSTPSEIVMDFLCGIAAQQMQETAAAPPLRQVSPEVGTSTSMQHSACESGPDSKSQRASLNTKEVSP